MFASSFKHWFRSQKPPEPISVILLTLALTIWIIPYIMFVIRDNFFGFPTSVMVTFLWAYILLHVIASAIYNYIDTSQMDSLIWSTYLISMFVLYEAMTALIVCANFMGFWAVKDMNILTVISCSLGLLVLLILSIQSSWNHLALINHTLKKIEITDFQLKFSHLYENMFCMCFYMLNRFGTAYIIFHYVQERERTLKEFGALTNMGYLQCGIMLLCNETGFMDRMTFLMKCTRKAPQDELHVEV